MNEQMQKGFDKDEKIRIKQRKEKKKKIENVFY